MADYTPLSDDERAELEKLRAEKLEREKKAREAAERAELESLRREQALSAQEQEKIRREHEAQEKARKLMEPNDDDLKMAPGQKIVIVAVIGIALLWLLATILG